MDLPLRRPSHRARHRHQPRYPTTGLRGNGTIYSDYPGSAWDVWIQGGGTATAGTARNLALLGDSVNDRLVLNHAGEYTGGTRVESARTVTGGLNGAGKLGLAATDCGWEADFSCGQQGFCSAGKVMMGTRDGTSCGVANSAYSCRLALSTGCPP